MNGVAGLDAETPEYLHKHAAAVRMANSLSLIERRIWNVLLFRAQPLLLSQEVHHESLSELKTDVGYRGHNLAWLKQAFLRLSIIEIKWDILSPLSTRCWAATTALMQAEILEGGTCSWSYPECMRQPLYRPDTSARLNLRVQTLLRRPAALALWELACLTLGEQARASLCLTLDEIRTLLGLAPEIYPAFQNLSRRVIQPALRDINQHSDLTVSLQYQRALRRVTHLEFNVQRNASRSSESFQAHAAHNLLRVRLLNDFGLSAEDATRFLAKFTDPGYLRQLLDDITHKYQVGHIRAGRLQAYTFATLTKAPHQPPSLVRSRPAVPLRPLPSVGQLLRLGEARYTQASAETQAAFERAWARIHNGAGVFALWYREQGLAHPAVREEFYTWLGGRTPPAP